MVLVLVSSVVCGCVLGVIVVCVVWWEGVFWSEGFGRGWKRFGSIEVLILVVSVGNFKHCAGLAGTFYNTTCDGGTSTV